ncbi:MAG TPA: helix-hairpin-helix domain-containing protein [Terriglobales bacterium]|nr:helix-hairpin-helix domain-containing protein [Terriglobales bacterium]
MKGSLAALATGVAAALGIAAAWELKHSSAIDTGKIKQAAGSIKAAAEAVSSIDINTAGREQFMALPGMSDELVDRILDNRPYRNRLDLLSRLVVPESVYESIKDLLHVDGSDEAVKIAA